MSIQSVIGLPLVATIEAQKQAAAAMLRYIYEIGYDEDQDGSSEIKNVVFKYLCKNKDGKDEKRSVQVPILTLVPLPYMRINSMKIRFTAQVNKVPSLNLGAPKPNNQVLFAREEKLTSTWNANYSSTYHKSNNPGKYLDVSLDIGQEDQPSGIRKVLNILDSHILVETI